MHCRKVPTELIRQVAKQGRRSMRRHHVACESERPRRGGESFGGQSLIEKNTSKAPQYIHIVNVVCYTLNWAGRLHP